MAQFQRMGDSPVDRVACPSIESIPDQHLRVQPVFASDQPAGYVYGVGERRYGAVRVQLDVWGWLNWYWLYSDSCLLVCGNFHSCSDGEGQRITTTDCVFSTITQCQPAYVSDRWLHLQSVLACYGSAADFHCFCFRRGIAIFFQLEFRRCRLGNRKPGDSCLFDKRLVHRHSNDN